MSLKQVAKLTAFALCLSIGSVFADNPHVPRGPIIVADKAYTNETSNLTDTLYTPTVDGNYMIDVYAELSGVAINSGSVLFINPTWTDENGSEPNTNSFSDPDYEDWSSAVGNAQNFNHHSYFIHAIAGNPIGIGFQATLPPGGSYTAYVVVEQF